MCRVMMSDRQFILLIVCDFPCHRNIEELTKQINQLEIEMNHVNLENEELRERLGLDPKEPLDTTSIKKKKQVREEQALAMNRVLTKEVGCPFSMSCRQVS